MGGRSGSHDSRAGDLCRPGPTVGTRSREIEPHVEPQFIVSSESLADGRNADAAQSAGGNGAVRLQHKAARSSTAIGGWRNPHRVVVEAEGRLIAFASGIDRPIVAAVHSIAEQDFLR